jgi:hypothetical protein
MGRWGAMGRAIMEGAARSSLVRSSPRLGLCSYVLYVRRKKEGGRRKREKKKRKEKKREKKKKIWKIFGEKNKRQSIKLVKIIFVPKNRLGCKI